VFQEIHIEETFAGRFEAGGVTSMSRLLATVLPAGFISGSNPKFAKRIRVPTMHECDQTCSDNTFLFSSTTGNPEHFFQGYFFHGTDYVFGQAGFDEFSKRRGVNRLVREDGCYVQMEKQNGRWRFSADYSGFKKIFYFWDDGFWIVSNSLYRIVRCMRREGFPVRPNHAQLAAAATEGTFYPSGRGSFFGQLTTFDTIIQGVRCAPMNGALWIGSSGAQIEKDEPSRAGGDYRDHLARFIGTSAARLQTLMREPAIQIACDLTGGLDSRTVFALLLSGIGNFGSGAGKRLQIRSSTEPKARKDRAIAAGICADVGLSLNGPLKQKPKRLSGDTSYALWRDLCLGAYHPISFPYAAISPGTICLSGGGGENHRPFYGQFAGAPSAETFVAARTRNIAVRTARPAYESALRGAIDTILDGVPGHLDVLAAHYRHFRNRFHTGREPQYTVTLPLLASRLLDRCTAVAGEARFRNAQMHYDILFNLKPELLDIPFDKRRKRPGRVVRQSMTSIDGGLSVPAGACFIGNAPMVSASRTEGCRAVDALRAEFSRAKAGFAADFLGSRYIRRAERAVEAATRTSRFSGPVASKRAAVVLAAGLFNR
jgi:hypothetical protein